MSAAELVRETLFNTHPRVIVKQLIRQAQELLDEGIHENLIKAGLLVWDHRPGVSPALLPHLVSDAVRIANQPKPQNNWEDKLREELGG